MNEFSTAVRDDQFGIVFVKLERMANFAILFERNGLIVRTGAGRLVTKLAVEILRLHANHSGIGCLVRLVTKAQRIRIGQVVPDKAKLWMAILKRAHGPR